MFRLLYVGPHEKYGLLQTPLETVEDLRRRSSVQAADLIRNNNSDFLRRATRSRSLLRRIRLS